MQTSTRTTKHSRQTAAQRLQSAAHSIIDAMECLHVNKRRLTADGWEAELRRAVRQKDGTPEFLAMGRAWIGLEKMQGDLLRQAAQKSPL